MSNASGTAETPAPIIVVEPHSQPLQPFQMHELDPFEVCQRRAQEQAQRAIAVAAERDIAAVELAQRRADEVAPARAPAGQVECLGLLERIAGLLAP